MPGGHVRGRAAMAGALAALTLAAAAPGANAAPVGGWGFLDQIEGVAQTLSENAVPKKKKKVRKKTVAAPAVAALAAQIKVLRSAQADLTSRIAQLERATGAAGGTGAAGSAGADGASGAAGTSGGAGPQGPPGPEGPQGPRGDQGPKGSTGDTGATGPAGPTGPIGPQGIPGPPGDGSASVTAESRAAAITGHLADSVTEVQIQCDPGQRATGGGGIVTNLSRGVVVDGAPLIADGTTDAPIGWRLRIRASSAQDVPYEIYALCIT